MLGSAYAPTGTVCRSGRFSFSYHVLSKPISELPEGVDPRARELYLCDAEFERVLGRSRAAFEQLKPWRQAQLKKAANLF